MATSSNFKNYQSSVKQLAVKNAAISSRFKLKSGTAKACMKKPPTKTEVRAEIQAIAESGALEDNIPRKNSLLQTEINETQYPIACPIPDISDPELNMAPDAKKEFWFSKLFSLKPQA